jgi:hypothetical protein
MAREAITQHRKTEVPTLSTFCSTMTEEDKPGARATTGVGFLRLMDCPVQRLDFHDHTAREITQWWDDHPEPLAVHQKPPRNRAYHFPGSTVLVGEDGGQTPFIRTAVEVKALTPGTTTVIKPE